MLHFYENYSVFFLKIETLNSCFLTKLLAVAENSKLNFNKFECNAIGTLDRMEGKYRITEIKLFPILTIIEKELKDKEIRVMEMSEKACLSPIRLILRLYCNPKF
ncbi:hypothetical protein [Flavobacterium sp. N3904]|uniref:hypothetical protein n=1 Tax=Flavobacterium sp. N3904 TaxID=2986835 RepID=UPI00222530EA|nr:hypothetical protein [Flavobacterium sp. N3904]